MSRILPLILALTFVVGCSKSDAGKGEASTAGATEALTAVLNDALAMADQLITEGKNAENDLKTQLSALVGARVDRRLPKGEVDGASMRKVLNAYSRMHGLGGVELKLGEPSAGKAIPGTHLGQGAYPYETEQLVGTMPIAITVKGSDAERLQAFYEAMKKLQVPLLVLPTLMVGEGTSTYSGSVYFRRKVTPPERVHKTPTLAQFAEKRSVAVPTKPAELEPLKALHVQLAAKEAAVVTALEKQDKVAQQARLLQFLRKQAKASADQPAPKTIAAPAGSVGTPTPTPPTGESP